MYAKLGGMTGTADTEAVEFQKIYKLDVVVMPPNKLMRRIDHADVVYKSEREKFDAVVEEIGECHEKGQPVLVGTTSVEKSEHVSKLLKKARRQAQRAERRSTTRPRPTSSRRPAASGR